MKRFLHLSRLSVFIVFLSLSAVANAQESSSDQKVNAAFVALEAVQEAGAYIESIADLVDNGEITLPVGIKKGDYDLIIQKIICDENTGETSIIASCAFAFKDGGQRMAFEGGATIEGKNGLGTNGFLELLKRVERPLSQEATLIFKEGTIVNFDCDGVESFEAKMDLILASENIVPVNASGNPTSNKNLSTSFEAGFHNFDDFTCSFSFNQSFSLTQLSDVIFTLKGATLDQSDLETSGMITFPKDYFTDGIENEKELWKGISVSVAHIALPAFLKKDTQDSTTVASGDNTEMSKRIVIGMENVIFDDNGFSGIASISDVTSREVDLSSWDITLTGFSFAILQNELKGFGFGGDLNVPPLGDNSILPYAASFNPSTNEYDFIANLEGQYDFPAFRGSLDLDATSTLEVAFKDELIYPSLNASGLIKINATVGKSAEDTAKNLFVPDINFENLIISRDAPYVEIGSIGVSGDLKSPTVAGFNISISEIHSFNNNKGSGLAFNAGINLNTMFSGEAGLLLYGDYAKWKFDRVELGKIAIDYESGAFSLNGDVEFKNGDAIYGSGFRGALGFGILEKFTFDAVAVFGTKDNYRYFLTDVFFETSVTTGLPVVPLSFYGFGGGIYQRMQQSYDSSINSDFGKSLSGINYIPDNTVGMGFMAATKFALQSSPDAFSANVGLEMQFNNYGGLNFVQLRGDAAFMQTPGGDLKEGIQEKAIATATEGGKMKKASRSDLNAPKNKTSEGLNASMNIMYDVSNGVFTADLKTFLNTPVIKGTGSNNQMGWASAYFSSDKWYTYIGTPSDRLEIEIAGLARTNAYFMLGDDIPELPLPPTKVLSVFSTEQQNRLSARSSSALSTGSGLAFGASLEMGFNAKRPPFYADLGVGMGAEFLLKNYGAEAYCAGSIPPLGINGWYASAQAWAWVEAGIGMEVKVFGSSKRFEILDLNAAALLAGAGPNPFYFTGVVGGHFNVMGGLVSGQCDFDFELGDQCLIKGGSPFGESVIAQVTPGEGEEDVNTFAAPQAIFNIPVGLEMKVDEGGNTILYKVNLEEFYVKYKDSGVKVAGSKELQSEGKVYMLDPDEPFESQKDMIAYVKVGFQRKQNNKWVNVKGDDGKALYEVEEIAFKSGDRPKEIDPSSVVYSYPIMRQYNFYPQEHSGGYIQLSRNYAYLFTTDKPEGFNQVLRFTDADGESKETSFTHKAGSGDVRLEIEYSMADIVFKNDEIYQLSIVNVPINTDVNATSNIKTDNAALDGNSDISVSKQQAEGTLNILEEKNVFVSHFRCSKYNTFTAKMENISNGGGAVIQEYPHVYNLASNVNELSKPVEMFDIFEGNPLNRETSNIKIIPNYEKTTWYKRKVAPLIYDNSEVLSASGLSGLQAPTNGEVVKIVLLSDNLSLTDEMIETGTTERVSSLGAINFRAAYYIDQDYVNVRDELANKTIASGSTARAVEKFLATNNIPDMTDGKYTVNFNYTLPGKGITTSTVEREIKLSGFVD